MATLVLTAVGTVVGGPVGGAVGALLGQAVDSRLFAPKARQGPRLGDLSVQTSSYGTQIPKLFGTMRVAGTVIWATDLREERSTSGGGKGQARSVNYSYSANFAVALAGRPIQAVRRIWADGKLLRGAAGDFKSATQYRLYLGGEDEPVDPLIASVEGAGLAPAYRGLAYAVFEQFQLADYGNRIPSLTFEVEADAAEIGIGAIAATLAPEAVEAGDAPALLGYAASGDSVRAALEGLTEAVSLSLVDTGTRLRIGVGDTMAALEPTESGASAGSTGGRDEWARKGSTTVPRSTSLAYYDPARDYQAGLQRAAGGGSAVGAERIALAAALSADAAKAMAEARLRALWAARESATLNLLPQYADTRPGQVLRLAGKAGLWRTRRIRFEHMVVIAELERLSPSMFAPTGVSAGRPVTEPDRPACPTTAVLLDLPALSDPAASRPRLLAAAAGAEGWRGASLSASYDGGASWTSAGAARGGAVIGRALSALPACGSALLDLTSSVDVQLLSAEMWLESRDDAALLNGANAAALGDEIIQFGAAEPLGDGQFRLSRMLRGRRGTEWAAAAHAANDPFVLLDPASLVFLEPPLSAIGATAELLPQGVGDPEAVGISRLVTGEAVRPPSPVHLRAERQADGSLLVTWVRRSRMGWEWMSGSDTPLSEETEGYRLSFTSAGGGRTVELTRPVYRYDIEDQEDDGLVYPFSIQVAQLGTFVPSRPAILVIS